MLKISFNFDEKSQTISGLKVENFTPKIKAVNDIPDESVDLEVLDNKLKLSKAALEKLNAKADDRISIQYWNDGIGKAFPIIGKAEVFTDKLDGNRLTKANTVAFRGEKHVTLVQFGELFNLEEFKTGIWKLVPIDVKDEELEEENKDLEDLDDSAINNEIEKLTAEDDLPFYE